MNSRDGISWPPPARLSPQQLSAAQPASAEPSVSPSDSKLAIDGGPKAVQEKLKPVKRWGEPERERLNAAIEQNTMFYWQGPQTKLFTERFREVCPVKYVMTCSSGTAALHIAAAAAGIGPGDEVITTGITDVGTVIGVLYQQGVPVFADLVAQHVQPRSGRRRAENHAEDQGDHRRPPGRQSVPHGRAESDRRQAQPDPHRGLRQAWGAKYRGKPVGTIGHIACFSLQQTKQITAGDGGAVGSSDERFGPLLQRFGDKGASRTKPGLQTLFATNYRMTELQAGFAAAQLTRLENIASTRSHNGNLLGEKIAGIPGIVPHGIDPADRATYWFYMFRMEPKKLKCDRAQFVKALVAEGVPASAGYIPVRAVRQPGIPEARLLRRPLARQGNGADVDGLLEGIAARNQENSRHQHPHGVPRRR